MRLGDLVRFFCVAAAIAGLTVAWRLVADRFELDELSWLVVQALVTAAVLELVFRYLRNRDRSEPDGQE